MRAVVVLILLALVLGLTPLSAREGETLDQCRKRYGKAVLMPAPYDFGTEAKELVYYNFQKNGITIEIGFLNGKASDLSFQHSAATAAGASVLTQTEIDVLLAANSGNMTWKTVNDGKLTFFPDCPAPATRYGPYRQRDDGVLATVDGPTLHIFTPEWMTYINDKMKAHNARAAEDQKKNLEGF